MLYLILQNKMVSEPFTQQHQKGTKFHKNKIPPKKQKSVSAIYSSSKSWYKSY